jgi:PQQ-dependent catabolism-associated beta-propeller protein
MANATRGIEDVAFISRPEAHLPFQWTRRLPWRAQLLRPGASMIELLLRRARRVALLIVPLVATAAVTPARHQRAAGTPRLIIVSNERSHDLTVIDGATLQPISTIAVPGRARGVRVSPDHAYALVALSDDRPQTPGPNDAIAEVDLKTHKVLRRIPAGTDPEQFAITPDGRRIVAANEDAGNASIIDPVNGKVLASLVVGTEPEGVTVSPDGRWGYVTAETSNTISVIDMRSEKVVATFLVDARPRSVAFSPDGRFAFATSEVGGSVARIDARKHRVLARMRVGTGEEKPVGIAVSPDGRRLYVALGAGHALVKLDAASLKELGRVAVGRRPWGVALSPDGRVAYTANGLTDDISVVDVGAMKVSATVKVGTRPWGIAVVP